MAPSMAQITEAVCEVFDVSKSELMSSRRDQRACIPRMAAYKICRDITGWSYPRIGRHFGRDHTSVISGVRRCASIKDPDFHDKIDRAHIIAMRKAGVVLFKSQQQTPMFKTTRKQVKDKQ